MNQMFLPKIRYPAALYDLSDHRSGGLQKIVHVIAVIKQSNLRQIPIQINGPIRDWTGAMVRNDKDRCVRSCVLRNLPSVASSPEINATRQTHCRLELLPDHRIVLVVAELPKSSCPDRHEHEHHDVLDPMLEEMESHVGPLFVQLTHFFEHTVTTLVVGHGSQKASVELQRTASCLLELLSKLQ